MNTCTVCGGRYKPGRYSWHATSRKHMDAAAGARPKRGATRSARTSYLGWTKQRIWEKHGYDPSRQTMVKAYRRSRPNDGRARVVRVQVHIRELPAGAQSALEKRYARRRARDARKR